MADLSLIREVTEAATFVGDLYRGIGSGVAAGLILALFFGIRSWISVLRDRREQIRYLRYLVLKYRGLIEGASAGSAAAPDGNKLVWSKVQLQKAYWDGLCRELDRVLAGRVSRLKFDEINEVWTPTVGFSLLFPSAALDDSGYQAQFEKLENLGWLGLSKAAQGANPAPPASPPRGSG